MKVINAEGINDAMHQGLTYLVAEGIREESRNGAVLVAPEPVTTIYRNPLHRVAFSATRNANPFFHLMEALWMLTGKNNMGWPVKFNKKFISYSDDGVTQFGAYGWRWRKFFDYDQIDVIINELVNNPTSRRCVLAMWNGMKIVEDESQIQVPSQLQSDLYVATHGGKDVPCNTHVYFDCRGGNLNMTVCNRSNDVVWGAYGANVVHFSILQEYMASRIGVEVGVYRQMSNNFHAYTDIYDEVKLLQIANESRMHAVHYELRPSKINHFPLFPENPSRRGLEKDIVDMMYDVPAIEGGFVALVAQPMYAAWKAYKEGAPEIDVLSILGVMPTCDWQIASIQWMQRTYSSRGAKNAV